MWIRRKKMLCARSKPALFHRIGGCQSHAPCDSLPVAYGRMAGCYGVAKSMPKIKGFAHPLLQQVLFYKPYLNFLRTLYQPAKHRQGQIAEIRAGRRAGTCTTSHVFFDKRKIRGVGNNPVLDALGQTATKLFCGECFQYKQIAKHPAGKYRTPNHVFVTTKMNAVFPSKCSICLSQQRGRYQTKGHPPHIYRPNESRKITHRPSAHANQKPGAIYIPFQKGFYGFFYFIPLL